MVSPLVYVKDSALAWTCIVASVVSAFLLAKRLGPAAVEMPLASLAVVGIALMEGLVFGAIILMLDRTRLQQCPGMKTIWVCALVAGGLIGPQIAVLSNDKFDFEVIRVSDPETYRAWGDAIYGPLVEEWVKGVLAFALIILFKSWITRPTQGFFIGAFTGLGFQIIEDIWYGINAAYVDLDSDLAGGVTSALVRGIFGVVSHWTYTGIVALGLCYLLGITFKFGDHRLVLRIAIALGYFALAYVCHALWNSPLQFGLSPVAALGAKFGISLVAVMIVFILMARNERNFVKSLESVA